MNVLGCVWSTDTDGHGDGEIPIGAEPQSVCIRKCELLSNLVPKINGVTRRKSDGKCWCEIGMKVQVASGIYSSCFLRGKKTEN